MNHGPYPPGIPGFNEWTMGGACVGDFNRDGWPDIFILKGGNGSDKLYINNGNGTFMDQTVAWGLTVQHCGNGATVGDFDRDGWLDIYVTSYGKTNTNLGEIGKNKLFRNTGGGSFQEVAVLAGVNVTSPIASAGNGCAWGDYDLDGDLDLAVAAWSQTATGNRLFRNNGDGTFSDVTGAAIDMPTLTWGFQANFADLDLDRYPELLIAGDFQTTRVFHNNRDGTFTELPDASGMVGNLFGMGQTAADFDRDGDLDWYVTSIFNETNPNPAYLNGNAYYETTVSEAEGLTFLEKSAELGVNDGGWGWGVVSVDFDHDGWLDMVEANGRSGGGEWTLEPEYYFRGNGDGSFTRDETVSAQFLNADARTVLTLDYDRDGDLDVAIYYNIGPFKLYRNDSGKDSDHHWLQVHLSSETNPTIAPNGYGSRVVATVDGVELVRYLDGGNGYCGSSELLLHFGLGDATEVTQLRVEWARGYVTTLSGVTADQRLTITAPKLADLDSNGTVGNADVQLLVAAWGEVTPETLHCDLNNDGFIGRRDLAIILGAWEGR
ncbi:MAG: VCBS repeat-containing protein [Phycisphaerae bacterium]|nr:VCBS repeat-containing protein [Phycisphaerae bacterium]